MSLAEIAKQILDGEIKPADEHDPEYGWRFDGENCSTTIPDFTEPLAATLEAVKPADRKDTQFIEQLLQHYDQSEVIAQLERYDSEGWEVA